MGTLSRRPFSNLGSHCRKLEDSPAQRWLALSLLPHILVHSQHHAAGAQRQGPYVWRSVHSAGVPRDNKEKMTNAGS